MNSPEVFDSGNPVSHLLERDVLAKLRRGMQVWLDKEGVYTQFVNQLRDAALSGGFDPVVSYRGSFLRTLTELEGLAEGGQDTGLLVHLPGFNSDDVRDSPLLAYYQAGRRYQYSLNTLIENAASGHVPPEEIEKFLAAGPHTLEQADEWLSAHLSGDDENGLRNLELHWIWERLSAGDEERLPPAKTCLEHLRTVVSLDLAKTGRDVIFFSKGTLEHEKLRTLADALAAWCMAIEYVDDLRRAPVDTDLQPLTELNQAYRDSALKLVSFLRNNHADDYRRIAMDFEAKLAVEREAGTAEDLGEVDTFSFEDERVMSESLERLRDGDAVHVSAWAEQRRPRELDLAAR